jgi:hypothetical protein
MAGQEGLRIMKRENVVHLDWLTTIAICLEIDGSEWIRSGRA